MIKNTKKKQFNKICINLLEVDFFQLLRVGNKVRVLLSRKIKNPMHAYLLLKMLCYFFENTIGFRLEPEEENKLRTRFHELFEVS